MGSSLPAQQLVTQTDTSSLSPAAVQVLLTPLISGECQRGGEKQQYKMRW